MQSRIVTIASLASLLVGCTGRDTDNRAASTYPASDTLVLRTDSAGASVVEGFGFVMPVPNGTTLDRRAPKDNPVYYAIHGPERPTPERTPDQGPAEPEPIFEINISLLSRNLDGSLDHWVDSLRQAQNRDADQELAKMDSAEVDSVGHRRALRLRPFCGDCDSAELYVASDRRIISFSYSLGIHLAGTSATQSYATRRVLGAVTWASGR